MNFIIYFIFLIFGKTIHSQSWNTTDDILPWETYLQLGDIQRPLGLILNRSSLAHRHFTIGYLCLHSFMYDEAKEAFDLAINTTPTFIEAYIGKMLSCKQALWSYTDLDCGQAIYNTTRKLNRTNFQEELLSTVYQWYAYKPNITAGEDAFLLSIRNLSQNHSNETDIRVLLGLSLLNVAKQIQNQSQIEPPGMIEARNILEDVLKNESNHSGALHYLIHAYDVVLVNISQQAQDYADRYGKIVTTSSHAQHIPSHIWIRIGSWNRSLLANEQSIIVSLRLCTKKLLVSNLSISSIQLESIWNLLNTTQQKLLIQCDVVNRAYSMESLSYSRLQTGNWLGSLDLLRDLYFAYYQSNQTLNQYLSFAYRTQTRMIIELFYWFPYKSEFLNKIQQLLAINGTQTMMLLDENTTQWYPIWSEAGFRFSECLLRLLINVNNSNNIFIIDEHLTRLNNLSNRTVSLNPYVSISISIMISQIRGIRYYINQSWQECLNELNNAVKRELTLIPGTNSPSLIFINSSELLAVHLLLIHRQFEQGLINENYTLKSRQISIVDFPSQALILYKKANEAAPNRVINIVGMARANTQLGNTNEAIKLYQLLLTQMNLSNNTDLTLLKEAADFIAQNPIQYNSASNYFSSIFFFAFCIFFFYN
ncbi:unnamed protein product [Rotaria sordida]|uniref:Uncharacterized protein n=1 Tax=Rotaria sordida TaxID=392033 RepID=A0A814QZL0_9BILA|nr:unnamed protein product [Rotaria sordida]CAF1441331.1 unnamed protein product [Rotaria sordida]